MTDIALRDDAHRDMTIPSPVTDPTGGRLVAWAEGLAAAHRIGSALCATAFAPQHFRGKPEEAAAAIMFGDEIGLSPTQSLRSIFVISGTPSLYARQMVALVLHHGHEVWTVEKSDAKVTVAGRRRGSSHVHEETWTTSRAQKAGYTNNKKYSTDPQAMLYARAAADVCRQIAPDALAGLAYSVEEMELTEEPTTTVTRRPERKTTAQRKPAPAPQEPELDEPEPAPEPDPDPEPTPDDKPTEAARRAMFAAFADAGMPDGRTDEGRAARLRYCADVAGRPIESSNDLSAAEVSKVLDALKADADADQAFTDEAQR